MNEEAFLQSILEDPAGAAATWLVLADWLEEHDDPRGELVRLCHDPHSRLDLKPAARDERVRWLLTSGLKPCVPAWTNSLGLRLTLIPAGAFLMGSSASEADRSSNEEEHEVEITRPFHLGICAVTQQEYQRVMDANPSAYCSVPRRRHDGEAGTEQFPVDSVLYADAVEFCEKLSKLPQERRHRRTYRLPTEAEWEYACRAGARVPVAFHFGASLSSGQANFNGTMPYGGAAQGPYLGRTTPVGSYPPSAWGLYDMHGNVWEWVADWDGKYPAGPQRDPGGPRRGRRRIVRGGSSHCIGRVCRTAYRGNSGTYFPIGFRIACDVAAVG